MWNKQIKKAIFTLNVENFDPEITELTFPLLKNYAKKIGAEFVIIKERKFLDWPVTYEKLQIYKLAQEMGNDWNIYIDADALIHPDLMDFTSILSKDTVAHHGSDFASMRWRYDRYFLRDGRNISSGNWFTLASDWCIDLWHPLDDLTLEEALANITPIVVEENSNVFDASHLIDDYVLSRNIAKYGFKFTTIREYLKSISREITTSIDLDSKKTKAVGMAWHQYLVPKEVKIIEMKKVLKDWGLMASGFVPREKTLFEEYKENYNAT
jgi:hypothetical protein